MRFFILILILSVVSCNKDKGSFAEDASFESVWIRYQAEVKSQVGSVDYKFNAPANLVDVDSLNKVTGLKLPEAVLELYKMGDGQAEDGFAFFKGMTLLSTKEVVRHWQQMQTASAPELKFDNKGPVKAEFWNKKWLPIAADAGNNYTCVDFDPALGGASGQLIRVYSATAMREYIARSPKSYFAEQASGLKNGQLKFDDYGFGPFEVGEPKK